MTGAETWALGLATAMALATLAQSFTLLLQVLTRLDRIEHKLDEHVREGHPGGTTV